MFIEELVDPQPSNKFPAFYGIQGSSECLQLIFTSAWSVEFLLFHFVSLESILILSFHLRLRHWSGLFPSGCPNEARLPVSSPLYLLHALPISSTSVWSIPRHLMSIRITYRRSSHHVTLPCLFLLQPSALISSAASSLNISLIKQMDYLSCIS